MKTGYLSKEDFDLVYRLLMPENALVMKVCVHTGLRVDDVLSLRTEQISRQFWVREKKTGKRRRVNLPRWLEEELLEQAGERWVFEGGRDPEKHRTRQAVWHDVKRAAEAMRLDVNLAPHSARKAFAVDLLERTGDVERVKRALNHSDLSTTLIYALADKMAQRKGRGKP